MLNGTTRYVKWNNKGQAKDLRNFFCGWLVVKNVPFFFV